MLPLLKFNTVKKFFQYDMINILTSMSCKKLPVRIVLVCSSYWEQGFIRSLLCAVFLFSFLFIVLITEYNSS